MTTSLTLSGKEPSVYALEEIGRFKTEEELRKNVRDVFNSRSQSYLCSGRERKEGLSDRELSSLEKHTSGYYIWQDIIATLTGLPSDHPAIDELVQESERHLIKVPNKSSKTLRTPTKEQHQYLEMPFFLAFHVAAQGPEQLYPTVKKAAYHIIGLPVVTTDEPPEEDPIMTMAAGGMRGYCATHRDEVLAFTDFLRNKHAALPQMLGIYAEAGDVRALDAFVEIAAEGDSPVIDGIRRPLAVEFNGFYTVELLKRQGFSRKELDKHVSNLPDSKPKEILHSALHEKT